MYDNEKNLFDVVFKSNDHLIKILSQFSNFTDTIYFYFHENELNLLMIDDKFSNRIIIGPNHFHHYSCKNDWVLIKIKPLLDMLISYKEHTLRFYMRDNHRFVFVIECIDQLLSFILCIPSEIISKEQMEYILYKYVEVKPYYVSDENMNDLSNAFHNFKL